MARAFTDKAHPPTDADFERVLGSSARHWQALMHALEINHGPLALEWKFYGGVGAGWTRKVMRRTRNLFFVAPHDGHFVVAFVMGDKAVAAVERSDVPPALVDRVGHGQALRRGSRCAHPRDHQMPT